MKGLITMASKTTKNVEVNEMEECSMQCKPEVEKAIIKNDEEWQKRMLLLVMVMIIALLGLN